jgi:hypothetical protein
MFCGTQLKGVRISRTADDLLMFRATQLKDVVCRTGVDFWMFSGTQLEDVFIGRTVEPLDIWRNAVE